MGCCKT